MAGIRFLRRRLSAIRAMNSEFVGLPRLVCTVYPKYELTFGDDGIKNAVLSFAKKEGQIVSIELSNSECDDAVGFVESFDEEICCIKAVDEYGIDDGISYVNYEDITRIVLMSYDEKRLMRLWRYNQQ